PAEHHLQTARHGTRPLDREEERAAVGRRHRADRRTPRRGRLHGNAARCGRRRRGRMTRRHIVIVGDEPNIRSAPTPIPEGEGYAATVLDSSEKLRAQQGTLRADLYLLDVRLPDGSGIDILRSLRQSDDLTPVVMISGHATIRDAVDATRSGALDFLEKP